jgi:hypothetical protein
MAAPKLFNLAQMTTYTTGTGPITLIAATPGYRTFTAAGVVNGDLVRYFIYENGAREYGYGVVTVVGATVTMTRTFQGSTTGALISLQGSAVVTLSPTAEDFVKPVDIAYRSDIATISTNQLYLRTLDGAPWVHGTSTGPMAIQDATGQWWQIDTSQGLLNAVWFGADPTGATASQAALNAALATGVPVYLSPGIYLITDKVTILANGKLYGAGPGRTILNVTAAYNMSATSVVQLGTNCEFFDVGFTFYQDMTVTTRPACIQYPFAIDGHAANRWFIDRIRILSSWNGINMLGNCGGSYLGRLEICALNIGIDIDGPLDFITGGDWEFWPYGINGSTPIELNVYFDGTTIAVRSGRCDGLSPASIVAFRCSVVFTANNAPSAGVTIPVLDLDDTGAMLTCAAGPVDIAILRGSGNDQLANASNKIIVSGGNVLIGTIDLSMTSDLQPDILVNGGNLVINGGHYGNPNMIAYSNLLATSGMMDISNLRIGIAAASRTAGAIANSGTGQLRLKGIYFGANGGPYTGDVITLTHDNLNNWISDAALNGWGHTISFSTSLGYYDFDGSTIEPITITPKFTTLGDFVPSSVVTAGGFKRRGAEVFVNFTTTFDTNAFTTAAGSFKLGTNLPAAIDSTNPLSIGAAAIVTATGVIYAQIDQATSNIGFPLWASGVGLQALGVTHVLPSKTGVSFRISGTYRVRS